jgi:hypothetical protein
MPLADFDEELLATHLARDQPQNEQGSRQAEHNRHKAGDYDARSLGRGHLNLLQRIDGMGIVLYQRLVA